MANLERLSEPETSLNHEDISRLSSTVAFVLCGGYGTRLKDLTKDKLPKPLFPLGKSTIIDYSIQPFRESGVGHIVLIIAHNGIQIENHFNNEPLGQNEKTKIMFTDQGEPTGVVPAIQLALQEYRELTKKSIIISDGDAVRFGLDIKNMYEYYIASGANVSLLVTTVEDTSKHYGIIVSSEDSQVVSEIVHFPPNGTIPNNLVFTGLIMCNNNAMRVIENKQSGKTWSDMLSSLFKLGGMSVYFANIGYHNINTPEELLEAESAIPLSR